MYINYILDSKNKGKMMKKLLKFSAFLACVPFVASALEFGSMGARAAGMGGVGVSMKHTQWGLYYNPALIASKPANIAKIGYSLNVNLNDNGLLNMFSKISNGSIRDINAVNQALKGGANVSSQGGIVAQIMPIAEGHNLSFGVFYGAFNASGGWGSISTSTNQTIDSIKNSAGLESKSFFLLEVPIGYAYNLQTPIGDIALGAALKLQNGLGISHKQNISNDLANFISNAFDTSNGATSSNAGIDLGINFTPDIVDKNLSIGLVGKNLNSPKFKINGANDLTIKPQVRGGVSYDVIDFLTLAADIDLTSNTMISQSHQNLKSQLVGAGVRIHSPKYENIDIRFGLANDFRRKSGIIYTGGLSLGLIDIALQVSSKSTTLSGATIPAYINFTIGGGLSF